MRSKFPGYYTPTEDQFKTLHREATIVLDTNVLLDLYRYSDETVKALLETIDKLKDRIFIPYQVALEYHRNLNKVISDQIKKYEDTIGKLKEFKNLLEAKRDHPFLSENLHQEINKFCANINTELENKKAEIEKLIKQNPIKEKLASILDSKVGESFDEKTLAEIYEEGESRYKNKIPPGYKDDKDKKGNDKYGDLVIWKEIIKLGEIQTNIILVSSDAKEDWYLIERGKTIGPRPELVEEFQKNRENTAQRYFYMYPTAKFLEYFKTDVKPEILDEVKSIIVEENIFEYTEDDNDTTSFVNEKIGEIDINREQKDEC